VTLIVSDMLLLFVITTICNKVALLTTNDSLPLLLGASYIIIVVTLLFRFNKDINYSKWSLINIRSHCTTVYISGSQTLVRERLHGSTRKAAWW